METSLAKLDWSLVQSFLAVAETGSLSAAARRLGLSQPTVGRHVQALEKQLGTVVFGRRARGLELSETGTALLPAARAMHRAAGTLARIGAGRDSDSGGPVRITASLAVAHDILPPILADLRCTAPRITVEIVASDTSENLLFGEADIAVRMYRPTQLDMMTRHIGDMALGVFAARSYLARRGCPETIEDLLSGHDLIGYDRDEQILRGMRQMGLAAQRDWFVLRCDNHPVYWQLLRAGAGIGFAQAHLGRTTPEVRQILPDLPIPALPVWLTTHRAMRQSPRIRKVWAALETGLAPFVS